MDKKHHDYEQAFSIACEKFEELCPLEQQPKWLKYCMAIHIRKNQNKNFVIKFFLTPKPILGQTDDWEYPDDGTSPLWVRTDSKTNEKSIVICGGPPVASEIFFAVEIDTHKNVITLQKYIPPNTFDGSQYQINERHIIE